MFSIIILLLLSALLSGLTLGLMSLSTNDLKRKAELGHKHALLVYPLRQHGNELLVSLILGNTLVNAILTVVLNSFLGSMVTVITATILIMIFGEILPQAYLKKHGLLYGAKLAPYINKLMLVARPLSRPIGSLLDKFIGDEAPVVYSKQELLKIMDEHQNNGENLIESEDLNIAKHALSFADKKIKDVMIPLRRTISVEAGALVTAGLIDDLYATGHRRFPVYSGEKDNIIGIIYARNLVRYRGMDNKKVADLAQNDVVYVNSGQTLEHALNAFLKTKLHLFVVINEKRKVLGIITIEDIIDQALGNEFEDDFNDFDDPLSVARLN